jgi:hypothetical protein
MAREGNMPPAPKRSLDTLFKTNERAFSEFEN